MFSPTDGHDDCATGQCQECANCLLGSEEGQANRKAWNQDIKSYGKVPAQVPGSPMPRR